jgi:hypothetical protein
VGYGSLQENGCRKKTLSSPTASLEGMMLTAIINAKEKREVVSADIPNAFIQTQMPETTEGEENGNDEK